MAIGIWAGVSALALAIGPLVGGLLTEHLSWNWIFFVNVPVGVARDRRELPADHGVEGRDAREPRPAGPRDVGARPLRAHLRPDRGERVRLDVGPDRRLVRGRGRRAGPRSSCSSGVSARRCSTCASSAAARTQARTSSMLLVALAMFGVFFFVSLYMQNVLGYSAVQAGAAFLPMTVLIILVAPIAGKPSDSRLALADDERDGAARRPAALLLQLGADATSGTCCPACSSAGSGWRWR